MKSSDHLPPKLRFGSFEVDVHSRELLKDGNKIRLQRQPLALLAMLLEQPGELVTRDELRQKIWPEETFVDFDLALNTAVKKIRAALGDSAEKPSFIETLHGRGYRFIGRMEVHHAPKVQKPLWPRRSWVLFAMSALVVLAAAVVSVHFLRARRHVAFSPRITSLAVLPLENLSRDPAQEYFVDGMTDELITNLAKAGSLRVISRTSVMQYKGVHEPLSEIAKALRVDAVLEGSILRMGDKVRITAQLIHVASDQHLWAEEYTGDLRDVFALQGAVARDITQHIKIKLTTQEQERLEVAISAGHGVNRKAQDAYLRGRYQWNKRTPDSLTKSIEYYQQAIAEDVHYARAYAGMADSYILLQEKGRLTPGEAYPKYKMAAMKAVEADPNLADGHIMLATAKEAEWDWAAAEQEYKRALELNPGLARAHHWYAVLLSALNRRDEAISEIERAVDLEPLAPNLYVVEALIYHDARRYDQALIPLRRLQDLGEGFRDQVSFFTARIYLSKGRYDEAVSLLRTSVDLKPDHPQYWAYLGYAYALVGRKEDAIHSLDRLNQLRRGRFVDPVFISVIWVGLGDTKKAMRYLEDAYRVQSSFLWYWLADPVFDRLRSDLRFKELQRRMNLPSNRDRGRN